MEIIDRITKFIEYKGINKYEFCKKNNLHHNFFHSSGNVTFSKIYEIVKNNPELNIEWLITGKGDMLKKTSPESEQIKDLQEKIYLYEKTISAQEETIRLLKKQLEECERNQKNSPSVSKTSLKLK